MELWIDPKNGNQVMAVYSDRYNGTVWSDLGYDAVAAAPELAAVTRDHKVTVVDGVAVAMTPSVNPVQPEPDPEAERSKARATIDAYRRSQFIETMKDDSTLPDDVKAAIQILTEPTNGRVQNRRL